VFGCFLLSSSFFVFPPSGVVMMVVVVVVGTVVGILTFFSCSSLASLAASFNSEYLVITP
jgi:hypothetical protein